MDQRHASLIPECDLCVQSVICNGMWTGSQSSKTQGFSEVRSTIIRRGEEECALAMTRQMFSGGDTVPRSSEGLQCYELWHGLRRSTNKLQRRICQRIFVIQENSLFLDKYHSTSQAQLWERDYLVYIRSGMSRPKSCSSEVPARNIIPSCVMIAVLEEPTLKMGGM